MNVPQPSKLPFLEFLGWQVADIYHLSQAEMLANYERGWRYHKLGNLPVSELAFIKQLTLTHQSWLASEFMNFQIDHHQRILRVLENINHQFMSSCHAYFGGGTLLALDLGEYRISNDIDFICPVGEDYRQLRNAITNRSPQILLQPDAGLKIDRFTADQYGIRMVIVVDDIPIKTEIIAEARFALDAPRQPSWSPLACLSISDCFTSKLLANADRYLDPGVHARDLIDLAFLRNTQPVPALAIEKAEAAYQVIAPLQSALTRFQTDSELRWRCYENLAINQSFQSQLIDGVDLLAMDLGMTKTSRTIGESGDEIFPFLE
jgi:Nucleotidyl transferase AbiEii toxin, Type IV TA system